MMVSNQLSGLMREYIINYGMFLAPALTAESTAFPVLTEQALMVKIWEKFLMPKSHC
jgi:hypothetical protein